MARSILHVDANAFYVGCEMSEDPSLRGKAVVVGGDPEARHGIVLAKSDLAKRAGIATGQVLWQAKQMCPGLIIVPPHYRLYIRMSEEMRQIMGDYTDQVEPFGLDEAWMDVTGNRQSGVEIANEIRQRTKDELGITVSAGVSYNKVFAKLGSDMRKPDATTIITQSDYKDKVWPLPAGDLLYVGSATVKKLIQRNMHTIGDIAQCSRSVMRSMLGVHGEMIWTYANGYEANPVGRMSDAPLVKSVGNSTTTPRDIVDHEDAKLVIYVLAESIAERLREQGLAGRVVSVSVRDNELHVVGGQVKIPRKTAIAREIADTAFALLRKHYHWELPARSLGVCVSELSPLSGDEQMTMFPDVPRERLFELERAVEDIRKRFGHFALQRALFLANRDIGAINPKDDHTIHPVGWTGR